jgi:hypothetical protein
VIRQNPEEDEMKNFPCTRIVMAFVLSAFLSVCFVTNAQAAWKVARVSSERAIGGLTPEAYWDQQLELHEWLMSELPDGALDIPIRVPLTRQDRNAIANDRTPHPRPLRVGMVKRVGRTVELWRGGPVSKASKRLAHGAIRGTNDGGFAWAVALDSDGASALRVQLSKDSLPDTADIYFFTLDGQAHGPYRGQDAFWSNSVMGSKGIVLVRQFGPPAAGTKPISISVSSVGNMGEQFAAAQDKLCSYNHSCIENAEDEDSEIVSDLMAATAYIQWVQGAWIYSCSGGLLADSDSSSQIPYFLTANHCLKSSGTARSLELYWDYTKSESGCAGPIGPMTSGATVRATGVRGDFTLLELDEPLPADRVLMGWNSSGIAETDGAILHRVHHPKGAPQSYSRHVVNSNFQSCAGLPIPQFIYSVDTFGTTEGGSSGSLVVNGDGNVVGQLYGGCGPNQNECITDDWRTVDGAFAFYYDKVAEYLGSGCDPSPEICGDNIANDCDSDIDCEDLDCTGDPVCDSSCSPSTEICSDNADNDCDSDIDCDDADCSDHPLCEISCEPKNGICSEHADCCSDMCKRIRRCR